LGPVTNAHAQEEPEFPTYIVQSGDTLYLIAVRFGVSLDEIIEVNEIIDPNDLSTGIELKIPGLGDIRGKLIIRTTLLGENIETISTKYQIPIELITQLNRIVSQDEIYVGTDLVIPERAALYSPSNIVKSGQSLFEIAILQNDNPWTLVDANMSRGRHGTAYQKISFMHNLQMKMKSQQSLH
jgi:LysM repeat protein